MKGARAAVRYAKAFLQFAAESKATEKVIEDARMIHGLIQDSKELSIMLQSPLVKSEQKLMALHRIFKGNVHELTLKLINQIVAHKREGLLGQICQQMISLYNKKNGIASVQVTTAIPLEDSLKQELLKQIKEAYSYASVEMEEHVNADLLGGMIMRIGDKQLDVSIRRQLNDIKKELV